jgi:hypothetical protein
VQARPADDRHGALRRRLVGHDPLTDRRGRRSVAHHESLEQRAQCRLDGRSSIARQIEELGDRSDEPVNVAAIVQCRRDHRREALVLAIDRLERGNLRGQPAGAILGGTQGRTCSQLLLTQTGNGPLLRLARGRQLRDPILQLPRLLREQVSLLIEQRQLREDLRLFVPQLVQTPLAVSRPRIATGRVGFQPRELTGEVVLPRARLLIRPPDLRDRLAQHRLPLLNVEHPLAQRLHHARLADPLVLDRQQFRLQRTDPRVQLVALCLDLHDAPFRMRAPLVSNRDLTLVLRDRARQLFVLLRYRVPLPPRLRRLQATSFQLRLRGRKRRTCRRLIPGEILQQAGRLAQRQPHTLQIRPRDRHLEIQATTSQVLVSLRLRPLPGEAAHLRRHLAHHVLQPGQIVLRPLQPALRRLAAVLVAADPRRLLEHVTTLIRHGPTGSNRPSPAR